MQIEKYNYQGDTNIGFYATATGEYIITSREFDEKEYLPETKVETRISGTNLVGLFTAGNSNCLLVPDSIKDRELEKIKEAGINYSVIESTENALGNVILANDHGAVISPDLEDRKEEISEALEVEVVVSRIASIGNAGVCGAANNHGAVIHRDASEKEAELVKETLQLDDINIGTVNMGSPYIGSGVVLNDEFVLTGHDTTGPEIGRLDRTLFSHE